MWIEIDPIEKGQQCPFCMSKDTTHAIGKKKFWLVFHCNDCTSSYFMPLQLLNKKKIYELINAITKSLENLLGDSYDLIIQNCGKSIYKGKFLCPICKAKLDLVTHSGPGKKRGKKKKPHPSFRWRCLKCLTSGFTHEKQMNRWKMISSLLQSESI